MTGAAQGGNASSHVRGGARPGGRWRLAARRRRAGASNLPGARAEGGLDASALLREAKAPGADPRTVHKKLEARKPPKRAIALERRRQIAACAAATQPIGCGRVPVSARASSRLICCRHCTQWGQDYYLDRWAHGAARLDRGRDAGRDSRTAMGVGTKRLARGGAVAARYAAAQWRSAVACPRGVASQKLGDMVPRAFGTVCHCSPVN